jgi:dienelactone hydrolase
MIREALVQRAREFSSRCLARLPSREQWLADMAARRKQWLEMLGLWPPPARTDLCVTRTGTVERDDFVVEKLHFQPVPGARVAANLYRPRKAAGRLPAVVFVCGHAPRGKFHYQPHPRWFARHGYVSMVLDAVWAGECGGMHHGIYSHGRWHWYSQGYNPAGFEVWAAMRALDYLSTRDDVDPARLGITGNSGGGSVSRAAGAADERFRAVVPSCETGTVYQHIRERTVDHHCDCTFWNNLYAWDQADVLSLVAPRPLLVAAQMEDIYFRRYGWQDVMDRVARVYALLGQPQNVSLAWDASTHGYTPATRRAIFSWFDRHLKGSLEPAADDIDSEDIDDAELAVYPGRKPPADDRMADVDRTFISLPSPPAVTGRDQWRRHATESLARLRATTFRQIATPAAAPPFEVFREGSHEPFRFTRLEFQTEPGLRICAHLAEPIEGDAPCPWIVTTLDPQARGADRPSGLLAPGDGAPTGAARRAAAWVEVRGTGNTSIGPGLEWSLRRSYPLLGQTLPERQVHDLLMGLAVLRAYAQPTAVAALGSGPAACLAVYAALLEESISCVVLRDPLLTHWDGGPEFLSILKVGDLPHNLALLFPRPILLLGDMPDACRWAKQVYETCGEGPRVRTIANVSDWANCL